MKRCGVSLLTLSLGSILWLVVLTPAASAARFGFNLMSPNTATASSGSFSGDTIRLSGSGNFDTATQKVDATGPFEIMRADGTVVEAGTWFATVFTSFVSFGGPAPGFQGGVLTITVTLAPLMGSPLTGQTMTVTCCVGGPAGCAEGTTVGAFTEKTGGTTLFHRVQ